MALIGTLTSGVSALKTFTTGLDVIGNNIANINTTGYKASKVNYTDTFSNTLQASSAATSTSAGDAAVQVGTGVQVGSINTDFTQGSLTETGTTTDLAISGNGYFVVEDTATGAYYVTRDGSFHFDSSGNLLTSDGYAVLDSSGSPITITNCTDSSGNTITYDSTASVSISSDGIITAYDSAGTAYTGQTVGLMSIADQSKLTKKGSNLYDFSATGSTIASNMGTAGTSGLGTIASGELESSNVDLTAQFADMITTQRSFQAASRLVTVSDTVLEDIVNLKR